MNSLAHREKAKVSAGTRLWPGCLLCLLLAATDLPAENSVAPFQRPPMQTNAWALSVLSTNLPPHLESAINLFFRSGMADPRGCDYREIEVVVGNFWTASGATSKTRGWILPPAQDTEARYAIGWNGLIYSVLSVGKTADAEGDARALIRSIRPPATSQEIALDLGVQTYVDEEYALNTVWLTPTKAAMIMRFASPDTTEGCVQLFARKDPFLTLSTSFLWDAFARAAGAHVRGDDEVAYATAVLLNRALKACEAEARTRGLPIPALPQGFMRARSEETEPNSYFPFLEAFPTLLRDQERRHFRKAPLRDAGMAASKEERIKALIGQLENVCARPTGRYAVSYSLSESPVVQALVKEGWDSIGHLLDCYEHDERLTRVIPMSHTGPTADLRIVEVRSAAYAALEGIIETPQFAPPYSAGKDAQEGESARKASAEGIREYWRKYRGLSREERLFAILKDDNGQWLEAASVIVQPTNKPIMPLVSWGYPWALPLDFADRTPMLGESLRVKENPSVTELLTKRTHDTLEQGRDSADDAGALNGACNLAFCLTKWDAQAGLGVLQELCASAFQKLAPTNSSSLGSHMDLAGQLSAMTQLRAKAGDTNALREYAFWLKTVKPQRFFLQIDPMLTPLAKFPGSPAWTGLWEFLFDDEKSAWFNYLFEQNRLDPKRMGAPALNVEVFFGTPVINNSSFRRFVDRLLQEKAACGKIIGEAAHGYWLDQQLSVWRRFGYTVEAPKDGSEINGKEFRTCDFYAWLLSNRVKGAPEFQLYWPEAKRDRAIEMLRQMLAEGSPFNTQPFQEP